MRRIIAGGIVLASLCGCASRSYVGRWTAENPPDEMRSITLEMNPDGTFSGVSEGEQTTRFAGRWRTDGEAVLMQHDDKRPGTATLVGPKRMVVDVEEGPTIQFRRAR